MSRKELSLGQDGQTTSSSPAVSPTCPPKEKLKEIMNPNWLRAHKRQSNILKITSKNLDLVFVPVLSSPPNLLVDDVASTYLAKDMGETYDDLHELFGYENTGVVGPSRLGKGRGKDIRMCEKEIRDYSNYPVDDVDISEDVSELGEEEERGEENEVFSASPIRFTMPSPPNDPHIQEVFEHKVDVEFYEDISENDMTEARRAKGILSCSGLASNISSENIMWMIEYHKMQHTQYYLRGTFV
ncbi:hypothetical protein POM88_053496 [Heracleum sosnowskyi]|uniref:Uncharacterized protein n=1 Tax=Heracleum sosnowskyi TaxID=360622 RepID=A0AAD8LXI2_9APIA|nr:hypothetical protein POM88_053496 [Heracleum sosnowskyi]